LGVARGHRRIRYDEVVVIGPPDVHYRSPHRQPLTDEPPASHEEARERGARSRSGGGWHEGFKAVNGVSETLRRAGRGRRLARPARWLRRRRRGRGPWRATGRRRWGGGERSGGAHGPGRRGLAGVQAGAV